VAGGRDIKPWLRRSLTAGGEQGFSLALALLVVLGALSAAVAITGRTLSNRQARQQLDAGLTARNAAEIGMTRIIAELNRPRNRRLLVNAPQLGASGQTVNAINGATNLSNPCQDDGETPDISSNGAFNSGAILNNEVTIPNTGGRLRYTLVAATNGSNNNEQSEAGEANESFNVTSGNPGPPGTPGNRGTLTLNVRGRVVESDGTETSRFNLSKTLAVVPKCCKQSFGGFTGSGTTTPYTASLWGNDQTACSLSSGYGLIVGARRNPFNSTSNANTRGSLSSSFAVFLERTVGGSTTDAIISRVYCTLPKAPPYVSSDCPRTTTAALAPRLTLKDIALPSVPYPRNATGSTYHFPTSVPTLNNQGVNNTNTGIPTAFRGSNVQQFARMRACDVASSVNSAWSNASNRSTTAATVSPGSAPDIGCRITIQNTSTPEVLETRNFSSWRNASRDTLKWQLGRLCQQVTWGGVANTIYCTLDRLVLDNADIQFDTAGNSPNTSIPIIISFPNGSTSLPNACTGLQALFGLCPSLGSGSGTVFTTDPDFQSSSLIVRNTSRANNLPVLTDFTIYGCSRGGDGAPEQNSSCVFQVMESRAANLELRNVFIYAPNGILRSSVSLLSFRGAYWGNKLASNVADSDFRIPFGSIDDIQNSFPSWTPSQLDLEEDYVARSVMRVGTFSD
jgi:hypothetical protein